MRELPDVRAEVRPYFAALKDLLVDNVKKGHSFTPLCIYVGLTSYGQTQLHQPDMIIVAPQWDTHDGGESRAACVAKIVAFLNRYADVAILCGCGRGDYTEHLSEFSGEVTYLFATLYLPGFTPWTLGQVYTIVEKEVLFAIECCSADGNVTFFDLPGLWPNGVAP